MAHLWRSTTDRARPRSRVVPIATEIDAGIKTDTSDTPEGADYGYTACAMTICQVQSPALAAPLNFGCLRP